MKINPGSLKEDSILGNEPENQFDGSTLGCALLTGFGIFFVLNSVFIIPDFFFALQNSECVSKPIPEYFLSLKTWMLVDASIRLFMACTIFVAGVSACVSYKEGVRFTKWGSQVLFAYWLFVLAWVVLGSVMFWGTAKNFPECQNNRVKTYLNIYFLVSYIGIILNCAYK